MITPIRLGFVVSVLIVLMSAPIGFAQGTAFTYQGKLTDGANPANGSYDFQFALFDSLSAGTQIGSPLTRSAVAVNGGIFTVELDYGVSAFPAANRFLLISVRPAGGGSFTALAPRQKISSTPYAIRTLSAGTADGLSDGCVACVQNAHINSVAGTKVTGMIPVASVPAGSGNYIQNSSTQQAASNFNISGNGTIGGNLITNGFVAIGVTSPQAKLQVFADGDFTNAVIGHSNNQGIGVLGSSKSGIGVVGSSDNSWAGYFSGKVHIGGNLGIGTVAPLQTLHVNGRARINEIPFGASSGTVCFNGAGDLLWCGASSLKLKVNVSSFRSGLDVVRLLNPISFDWKDGSGHDIGLGAEDVAKVAPFLTLTNNDGEIAGVKYERLNILLINAINEQQQQIAQLKARIHHLEKRSRRRAAFR
jgi:hypothetical protein